MSKDLKTASPREVRALIRAGEITSPTAGMAAGYAQANLVILPPNTPRTLPNMPASIPPPAPCLKRLKLRPIPALWQRTAIY